MAALQQSARSAVSAAEWIAGTCHSSRQWSNVGASSSKNVIRSRSITVASKAAAQQYAVVSGLRLPHIRALSNSTATRSTTGTPAAATSSNTRNKEYPFASSAIVRSTEVAPTANMSQRRPKSRGIMASLHAQLRQELDPTQRLTALFSRNSSTRIPIGSVLIIETYTTAARTGVSTFSGVLLGIRRRGVSTSFIVRNLVGKTGVEVMFNLYSPLLKDVRIVQLAQAGKDDRSGKLRRTRRAKLYYLRKDNRRLANIGKSIAAHRQQQDATRQKPTNAPGLRRLR